MLPTAHGQCHLQIVMYSHGHMISKRNGIEAERVLLQLLAIISLEWYRFHNLYLVRNGIFWPPLELLMYKNKSQEGI